MLITCYHLSYCIDILNGKINDNQIENYIKKINDIEKDLNKFKKSKKINKLKNYIKKIKNSVYGKDKYRVRTDEAKSFEDQKGKGHVNLLINNIKQLINYLYDTKQVTKQVYNNLTKAITHMQSTTF